MNGGIMSLQLGVQGSLPKIDAQLEELIVIEIK